VLDVTDDRDAVVVVVAAAAAAVVLVTVVLVVVPAVVLPISSETRIRYVERGICPIAAACTVLFYCPDVKP